MESICLMFQIGTFDVKNKARVALVIEVNSKLIAAKSFGDILKKWELCELTRELLLNK